MRRRVTARLVIITSALVALTGCTGSPAGPSPTGSATSSPTPTAPTTAASPTVSATPTEIAEPSTTNTLPPPPAPSRPAPTRAGELTARSLPVPAGWRTTVREGGPEEGYLGNGTWVLGRDPRYAAFESITMGCASVTRDDYPDPTAALEGTYQRGTAPGLGLIMEFRRAAQAERYLAVYRAQVERCDDPDNLEATIEPSTSGLVDRRSYPDGEWTEVVRLNDTRLTIVLLTDPGHRISASQIADLQRKIDQAAKR